MTWCVEVMGGGYGACWVAMHTYSGLGRLFGITRDEAVDRASRLPRCDGRYSYRVRRFW